MTKEEKRIDIIKRLNFLEIFILDNAYGEDWDGDDEETGRPIILKYYRGLRENEIKSLLADIGDIIESVKELEDYD